MSKLTLAPLRAILAAVSLSGAALVTSPASAAQPVVTPGSDPCSAAFVQGAIACQGYYGGNMFQGNAGSATSAEIQAILRDLLDGAPAPTSTLPGYSPPYTAAYGTVLATFTGPAGSTINFGSTMMQGLTLFGAHFGNNVDSDENNISAFWLFNAGATPVNSITLRDAQGNVTTAGTSNAQLYATRIGGAVPEPGTWALMLLGFGAVGASMRHRRRFSANLPQLA